MQKTTMAFWQSMGFQNILSFTNSQLESLHDLVLVWLFVIMIVVLLVSMMVLKETQVTFLELNSTILEVTWTILPIWILVSIAAPSIFLLCLQDTYNVSPWSLKLISNQWNWQSEQVETVEHLLDLEKLDELGSFTSPIIIPFNVSSRVLLTSTDVLHSFGVPSLGLKLDATPGRLNAVSFNSLHMGLMTGSCYELCGSGHSAMPVYLLTA